MPSFGNTANNPLLPCRCVYVTYLVRSTNCYCLRCLTEFLPAENEMKTLGNAFKSHNKCGCEN